MEFCVISPTAGLERYATLSKTHLVLAHEYERDVELDSIDYRKFYLKRREAGDFIILDNGAYEAGHPFFSRRLIQELQPQVVVLPDFYLQPWQKTWHAAIHYLDMYYTAFPANTEWLYIPQSLPGDINGFVESYIEAVQDRRITWLGIPRALAYAITDNPLARVEFARMVKRDHPGIHLHAFGMVNGDIHELPYLKAAGVESIDSSAPVWRGWNGNQIDKTEDRKLWDIQGTAVDFNTKWDPFYEAPGNQHLILHNLEACGVNTNSSKS